MLASSTSLFFARHRKKTINDKRLPSTIYLQEGQETARKGRIERKNKVDGAQAITIKGYHQLSMAPSCAQRQKEKDLVFKQAVYHCERSVLFYQKLQNV